MSNGFYKKSVHKAILVGDDTYEAYKLIEQQRTSGEDTGDLLSMLMAARDQETGQQMNDRQLRYT